jgi:uncharacterized protein
MRWDDPALLNAVGNWNQHLIILPTEKCNFRCTYCYEDFKIGKMKPVVVNAIKAFIERRVPHLRHLGISWFGGEPLAASDVVLDITSFASDVAKGTDCHFESSATTNGYLITPELFENLTHAGLSRYQISLDGYGEEHDRTRRMGNGKGTFDQIINNLMHMRDSALHFEVMLRVHFSVDGTKDASRITEFLANEFLQDHRFKIYFKSIEDYSGLSKGIIGKLDRVLEANIIDSLTKKVPPTAMVPLDDENICYASRPNSLLIRPDGRIGKCTIVFQDEKHTVGHIKEDGTLALDNDKMGFWMRGFETLDPDILRCPLKNITAEQWEKTDG